MIDVHIRDCGDEGDTIFFLTRGSVRGTVAAKAHQPFYTKIYKAPAIIGASAVVSFNPVYKEVRHS